MAERPLSSYKQLINQKLMKKFFAIFSLLAFVAVYTLPALTMNQQDVAKVVTVDKDKKVKASKAAKAETSAAKASCCEAEKGAAKASCCEAKSGEAKSCAATCKEGASCKTGVVAEKKK
jgi:hypothetical protein